jgi:hypothetical protein
MNNMNKLVEQLFGPMDKKYCDYFYILSIIGFLMMGMLLLTGLFIGISKHKGLDYFISLFMGILMYGVFYFQNRLIHSMCAGTIKN